jgi:hypothetical protein
VNCPWLLTKELFQYVTKYAHVSSTCRLSPAEEFQLLQLAITDVNDAQFDPKIYSVYEIYVVKNRLSLVKSLISNELSARVFSLPRPTCSFSTTGWPYYSDISAIGGQEQDWTDLTVYYGANPMISGEIVMKIVSDFWSGQEDMSGHAFKLGFLFVYGLLTVTRMDDCPLPDSD